MAGTFEDSMNQSTKDFQKLVLPLLKNLFSGCDFIPTENTNNEIATLLDTHAGIDVLGVNHTTKNIKGIASRIQRAFNCWSTFTVRCERDNGSPTEYKKREKAMKEGGLFPALTLQAYIAQLGEKLLGMAIIPTIELWQYIEKENPQIKHTHSEQFGQASFFVVEWRDMKRKQYNIMIIMPTDGGYLAQWRNNKKFIRIDDAAGTSQEFRS